MLLKPLYNWTKGVHGRKDLNTLKAKLGADTTYLAKQIKAKISLRTLLKAKQIVWKPKETSEEAIQFPYNDERKNICVFQGRMKNG